ncbi:MAG: carboxymuconolactone decarboxylase family protein [Proteobacteria bacterium]|nr:carboxymuconolactone decarboxylase family protein [Pseudomonadota bacterium]
MRLSHYRIKPLDEADIGPEIRSMLGVRFRVGPVPMIFRTIGRALKAYKRFMPWGGYILSEANDLSPRDRELVILRTGFNWKSGYEWAQHVRIGKTCGLTDPEIERIKRSPDTEGWSIEDRMLLRATDELTEDAFVTEQTWLALDFLTEKQKMDLVMTVGQYTQVCMMLNSFGVQLDEDLLADPDLQK